MKRIIPTLLLLTCSIAAFAQPPTQTWITPNGAAVYYVKTEAPAMLNVALQFRAGSIFSEKQPGLSAITVRTLGTHTKHLNEQQIANRLDQTGSIYAQSAGKLTTKIFLQTLTEPKHLTSSIHLLHDIVTQFSVKPTILARLKKETEVRIKDTQETPNALLIDEISNVLYKNTPLADTTDGTIDSVRKITAQQVTDFYKQYYTANNLAIVLVGSISQNQAKTIANTLSSGLPAGKKMQYPNFIKDLTYPNNTTRINKPLSQSYIAMTRLTTQINTPQHFALLIANQIFGGDFSSLLTKNVRKRLGLSYVANSIIVPSLGPLPFITILQAKPNNVALALKATQQTLQDFIAQGPTTKQLQDAKNYLTGNLLMQFDNNQDTINQILLLVALGLPIDYFKTLEKRINAVTQAQVQQAAKQYLAPNQLATIIIGKESKH